MRIRCVFLAVSALGMGPASFGQYISPTDSGVRIHKVAPTTRPWYEPDGSLESLNAGLGFGNADRMIRNMKEGLVGEQCPLASTLPGTKEYITEISDALHRSGDSPEITNTLHQALLTPKNLYLDIILHAYIMASPVPMTLLAETVVKGFPVEQRKAWYAAAGEKALYRDSWEDSLLDRPSREVLRHSHFLNRAKALETDPECLRVIGNPFDPGGRLSRRRRRAAGRREGRGASRPTEPRSLFPGSP